MSIRNTANPGRGFADFALCCDHCGEEINSFFPGNLEFTELGEAVFLHKHCTTIFRDMRPGQKFYWVGLEGMTLKVSEAFEENEIDLMKDVEEGGNAE